MLNEAVLVDTHLQSQGAGLVHGRRTAFFRQGEYALDPANRDGALALMKGSTEGADVRAGLLASP